MGISGLLPLLKKASHQACIKDYEGYTVAIDAYCWLHKGAFACAEKLATGEKTDQYVYYCVKYINMLLSYGIKPILVFDGCHLPSKKDVEKQRRERREINRKKAAQLLREGKRSEAFECLRRCVDVTSKMAVELMNVCRDKGVDCIVAPYEADAQLAYLSKRGIAQVIITEDSDLVLFGCERIMYKMDMSGNGVMIVKEDLPKAIQLTPDLYTFDKLRYLCILSGCDYLASLPGIGLAKATKLFQLTRQTDMKLVLRKMPTILRMSSLTVPSEYVENFFKANNTFLYQLVFDPQQRKLVPLNPYPEDVDPKDLEYAGPYMPGDKALQIALGNVDVNTNEVLGDFDPDTFQPKYKKKDKTSDMLHMLSIWDKNYRPRPKIAPVAPTSVDRTDTDTKGKEMKVKLAAFKRKSINTPAYYDDDAVPTDKEFSSMYGEGDAGMTNQPQKRLKLEENEVNRALQKKPLSPSKTPNTLNALGKNLSAGSTEASDVYMSGQSVGSAEGEDSLLKTEQEMEETKENMKSSPKFSPQKTPSKNRFAVKGKSCKVPFSLNATKKTNVNVETKSRFFSACESAMPWMNKSKEDEQPDTTNMDVGQDTEKQGPTDQREEDPSSNGTTAQGVVEKTENDNRTEHSQTNSQTGRNSPYGSFGFGKLDIFRSSFSADKKDTVATVTNSPAANNQFKPVLMRTSKSSKLKSPPGKQSQKSRNRSLDSFMGNMSAWKLNKGAKHAKPEGGESDQSSFQIDGLSQVSDPGSMDGCMGQSTLNINDSQNHSKEKLGSSMDELYNCSQLEGGNNDGKHDEKSMNCRKPEEEGMNDNKHEEEGMHMHESKHQSASLPSTPSSSASSSLQSSQNSSSSSSKQQQSIMAAFARKKSATSSKFYSIKQESLTCEKADRLISRKVDCDAEVLDLTSGSGDDGVTDNEQKLETTPSCNNSRMSTSASSESSQSFSGVKMQSSRCRGAGLAKPKGRGRPALNKRKSKDDVMQPNINDMFSKYTFGKQALPKLSSLKKHSRDSSNSEDIIDVTPETDKVIRHDGAKFPRKLDLK